ncbi:cold-shock protein [Rhodobacter sp. CZR27]|uniref:cold-shock protein n=1 Tax=Rhodobacter sp. CZR27 TaxID=2033869 RepID=UPI000BBE58AA|nr:cold shock domain-containing protein [Rhodobacter sp. CZR27]
MPFLATVETVVSTRGFGFLKIEGSKDEIFFHATAALSNDEALFLTLKEGDRLLCQVGSTLREPSKSAAVLWTPVAGRDWTSTGTPDSQEGLDRIRRDLFGKAGTEEIGRILAAGWYRRRWKENPPKDLQDPVLQQVHATALAALSPGHLPSRLHAAQGSPFAFVAALDPMSDVADLSALLATFVPSQLAAVCAPRAEWAQASGPRGKSGYLSLDHKVALLDWAALSGAGDLEGFRATWLKGDGAHEATFARQWLASEKPVPRPLLPWLLTLLEKDQLQVGDLLDLALREAHAGVLLHHALSDEDRARLQESWARDPSLLERVLEEDPARAGRLLETTVLAVDLETDGARIHQLGQADHRGSTNIEGSDLAGSLQQGLPGLVSALTQARLAVGHNAIGWDWPILSRAVPSLPGTPVWDTLLVAFLLEPQALSHALGGDHRADADARAALALFGRQAERFDPSLSVAILTGRCTSTEELFTRIVDAGPDDLSVARATPAVLEAVDRDQPLLLPERLLRLLDWVPGYVIAPADPETPLDPGFLEIQAMRCSAR